MPEVTENTQILMDISFRAYMRAKEGDQGSTLRDCVVMIVFAGFYIEATLNHIIKVMDKEQEVSVFSGNRHPGMQDKLAWFYNSFVAHPKIDLNKASKKGKLKGELYERLQPEFPGLDEIHKFRNDISHGKIDKSTANLRDAERLRKSAKIIVDKLIDLSKNADYPISREITSDSDDAIA